jgi:hypothetical protein
LRIGIYFLLRRSGGIDGAYRALASLAP